ARRSCDCARPSRRRIGTTPPGTCCPSPDLGRLRTHASYSYNLRTAQEDATLVRTDTHEVCASDAWRNCARRASISGRSLLENTLAAACTARALRFERPVLMLKRSASSRTTSRIER